MNVILIISDTFRYDNLFDRASMPVRTPYLDAFSKRAISASRMYASSFPTIPHRTDVMTGRYGDPFNPWMPLRFDVATLPRVLAEAGYATQLIHDTPLPARPGELVYVLGAQLQSMVKHLCHGARL